jgi:7,8-dihydropterin-6-yl-methyl-4-(beta-D-ribofuranosyl)aminobenzene 5'-phosphate synthase
MGHRSRSALALACMLALATVTGSAQSPNRITIIVDAFGRDATLRQDWGFSALVEYGGTRVLFDTGNNAEIFADNARTLGIDLTRLDAVVISHRHGDHTDGLHHLLRINPGVRIYAPNDEYFGGPTPAAFFQGRMPSLPTHMRYFGGAIPEEIPHGSPWREADLVRLEGAAELAPGIRLVQNISPHRQFGETPELSLVIDTPLGQVVLVGCSHPGIEQILESVHARETPVHLLAGGLHLVATADAEIDRLAAALHDQYGVERVAPGHCTGEVAFAALQRVYGEAYDFAGVGTTIELPEASAGVAIQGMTQSGPDKLSGPRNRR